VRCWGRFCRRTGIRGQGAELLPIKIEIVETRKKIEELLPEIEKRSGSGIIEIQETRVVVPAKR
jgi:PII-like signaling protein